MVIGYGVAGLAGLSALAKIYKSKGGKYKWLVVQDVLDILEQHDYEYEVFFNYSFDIFAKSKVNEKRMIIKVLYNVDVLSKEHAFDMKLLAMLAKGVPVVVGMEGRNYTLKGGVGYNREGILFLSLSTFLQFISEGEITSIGKKGKEVVKVNTNKIKEVRKENNLSLAEFASIVGISKKTAYLIEKRGIVSRDLGERLEKQFSLELEGFSYKELVIKGEAEGELYKSPYHKVEIKRVPWGENFFIHKKIKKYEEKEVRDAIKLNDMIEDKHLFVAKTPLSIRLLREHGKDYLVE